MSELSQDVLTLLTQLMPGFLTAWVVYGLTTYTRPPQFERLVQALIYSFLVSGLVVAVERALLLVGRVVQIGVWDKSSEVFVSVATALVLGVVLSRCMTTDAFFGLARRLHLTTRTPYPSEWYGAFASKARYLVLHLAGGRRILGYPIEWPTEPTAGHFRLTDAAWLDDNNKEIALDADESILIAANQVEIVELLKD